MNLAKLKTYSVPDSRGKLLDPYFKDCFHRVKLGPAVSEWEMVSRGLLSGVNIWATLVEHLSEILHIYDIDVNLNIYCVCR